MRKALLSGSLAGLLLGIAFAGTATANQVISERGSGAGQTLSPAGLARDFATGDLFVADQHNNRIDVFDGSGDFVRAFGWGVATGASTLQVCTLSCRAGLPGSGAGQLDGPTGVAVDNVEGSPSQHDVYVFDSDNNRVAKFKPDGTFLLTFGGSVNQTTGADLCIAGSGDLCGPGILGTGSGEFGESDRPIAVGPEGVVSVADSQRHYGEHPDTDNRIERFSEAGAFLESVPVASGEIGRITAFTERADGQFYVGYEQAADPFRKYNHAGAQLAILSPLGREIRGMTVDPAGHLLVAYLVGVPSTGEVIYSAVEYDASDIPLRHFGYEAIRNSNDGIAPLPASGAGVVMDEETGRVVAVDMPPPGPVVLERPCTNSLVRNVSVTATCYVNPEGDPTSLHFQYIGQAGFENGGYENEEVEETEKSTSIGEDFSLHAATLDLEGLEPESAFHYRVIATSHCHPLEPAVACTTVGPDSTVETKPPFEIGKTWSDEVGESSARLSGDVNPLGLPATGYFEYVDEASFEESGFATAVKLPTGEPVSFGAAETVTRGSATATGLEPGTNYHYRLAVSDAFDTRFSDPSTLTTFSPSPAKLPDSRGYELVSPMDKQGADLAVPGSAGGLQDSFYKRVQQASPDGEAVTFTSFISFGEAKSASSANQYLATRGAGGWTTKNVNLPGRSINVLAPPVRGFNSDLSLAAVAIGEPALTPEASPEFANLYLESTASGDLETLTPGTPRASTQLSDPSNYCAAVGGMTEDGRHVLVLAFGALTPEAPQSAFLNLYEWSPEAGLKLVSVLPDGSPAQSAIQSIQSIGGGGVSATSGFGAPRSGGAVCSNASSFEQHSISADGSKIFWTYVPKSGATRLLARIDGAQTVQIDAREKGSSGTSGGGLYWDASPDGSSVLFSDASKLVPGSSAESHKDDLYLYDFERPEGERLTDLTAGAGAGDVQGVLGESDDLSYVYFVARGALTDIPNSRGVSAEAGDENLYLWHRGEPVRFLARLSNDQAERADSSSQPTEHTAMVTPDGKALAFLSDASLTGYDNAGVDPECPAYIGENVFFGGKSCSELYLYSAEQDRITCASCNPSGARPAGSAIVPTWSSGSEQPRYLSDDGGRVFFESLDALAPEDQNDSQDVYEWEGEGRGTCTQENPRFSAASGGCLFLLSSGTSGVDSYLIDASSDGSDAFISTRQRLVPQDYDDHYDVYDVRSPHIPGEAVGFPSPQPNPPCEGEACKPPVAAVPSATSPSTSSFRGSGNVTAERKRKPHRYKHKKNKHKKNKHKKQGGQRR